MWILRLNDMRTPNIEIMQTVIRAETKEKIESLMANETIEPYKDDSWHKIFKKDGILEWFNAPSRFGGIIDMGTEQDWIDDTIEAYKTDVLSIPTI